jgi:hypothetical protein
MSKNAITYLLQIFGTGTLKPSFTLNCKRNAAVQMHGGVVLCLVLPGAAFAAASGALLLRTCASLLAMTTALLGAVIVSAAGRLDAAAVSQHGCVVG